MLLLLLLTTQSQTIIVLELSFYLPCVALEFVYD